VLSTLVRPNVANAGVSDIPSSLATASESNIETNQEEQEEQEQEEQEEEEEQEQEQEKYIENIPLNDQENEYEEDLFESGNYLLYFEIIVYESV
jgi:hypothetical protein